MKPLSPFKFFLENKKKVFIIVIILMLSVSVVAFITSIVNSIIISAKDSNLRPFEYASAVTSVPGEFYVKDEVIEKIKAYPSIDKTVGVIIEDTSFSALMGNTNIPIYFVNSEKDIEDILKVFKLEISEGVLPKDDEYEVILHENILKNKGLKVGDYIGNEVDDNEFINGKYKITGSLKGVAMTGFGSRSLVMDTYENAGLSMDKPMALMVIPKEGKLDELNSELDKLDKKEAGVYTHSSLEKQLDAAIGSINTILQIIIFVTVFVLSISVGSLIYIIYLSRTEEFGILYAMGYKKSFINNRIMKELIILSIICWILGFVLSMMMMNMINVFLLDSSGQSLPLLTKEGTNNTLFIPVMVLICAAFPILHKLRKWDPIAIIERRD